MIILRMTVFLGILMGIPFTSFSVDWNSYNTPINRAYALAAVAGMGLAGTWLSKYFLQREHDNLQAKHTLLEGQLKETQSQYKDQKFLNGLHKELLSMSAKYPSGEELSDDQVLENFIGTCKTRYKLLAETFGKYCVALQEDVMSDLSWCAIQVDELAKIGCPTFQGAQTSLLQVQVTKLKQDLAGICRTVKLCSENLPYVQGVFFLDTYEEVIRDAQFLEPFLHQPEWASHLEDMVIKSAGPQTKYAYACYVARINDCFDQMRAFMPFLLKESTQGYQKPIVENLSQLYSLINSIRTEVLKSPEYKLELQQSAHEEKEKAQKLRYEEMIRRQNATIERQQQENNSLRNEISSMMYQVRNLSSDVQNLRSALHGRHRY